MDNILGLVQDKHQWHVYDADFRRQQVNVGYSLAHTRVELYAKAVTRANHFRQQQHQQMQGRRTPNLILLISYQGPVFASTAPGKVVR